MVLRRVAHVGASGLYQGLAPGTAIILDFSPSSWVDGMGVQGLWEILQSTGQSRALAHLAVVDGFEDNASGRRALRVGIDASLWYQHASAFVQGEKRDIGANPDIRCLFFRLCNLAELPILPLFVFDGRQRPKIKRGSKKGKSGSHNLTQKMKEMLDAFGMEWRMALGEAEAELAYLNRVGVLDAIMTDDVDAFLFGAQTVIRNASLKLTGNRSDPAVNMDGKASQHHVKIFTADAIRNHPGVDLTRGGLILIALLAGGDYDKGLPGCGPHIAHGLARCGFGDQLLNAYEHDQGRFRAFLPRWRAEVNHELHTNSQGKLDNRHPGVRIPDTFPDFGVMETYADPICSGRNGQAGGVAMRDRGTLSLPQVASFCEAHFDEWGHRSAIVKRFRDLLWGSAVMHVLRRAALEADEKEKSRRVVRGRLDLHIRGPITPTPEDGIGTPAATVQKYLSPANVDPYADIFVNRGVEPVASTSMADPYPLLNEIVGSRTHVSTDRILEYRVVVNPRQLVDLTCTGIKGKHPESMRSGSQDQAPAKRAYGGNSQRTHKRPPPAPYSKLRLWLPASIMRQVHPRLVEAYENASLAKQARKTGTGRRAMSTNSADESECEATPSSSRPSQRSIRTSSISQSGVGLPPDMPSTLGSSSQVSEASRRVFQNVGMIDSELPTSGRMFLFTYTNPDDPDMADLDDEASDSDTAGPPALSVANNNIPGSSRIVSALRRKGKQKQSTASVESSDEDDWEPPPLTSSRLSRYDDMFDRILGIPPSQAKAKATAIETSKDNASRKRSRTQTTSRSTDLRLGGVHPAKKRKTAQATSSAVSAISTASKCATPSTGPSAPYPDRQFAPFPDLVFANPSVHRGNIRRPNVRQTDNSSKESSSARAQSHPHPVTQPRRIAYPSSSQESRPSSFLADVTIYRDLTTRKV